MKINNTEIILNCLAKDLDNAKDIFAASNNEALIGLLTKAFPSDEAYIKEANKWNEVLNDHVSVGLGGGDPKQSFMVSRVVKEVNALHINQVFTGTAASVENKKNKNAIVNSLISPSGIPGKVIISTGPESSNEEQAVISARTAFAMIQDMGGGSIKYFNMKNMKSFDEVKEIIKLCKEFNFTFEPTGGLDLENAVPILKEAIAVGLDKVIIHIYSSIIDKETGRTRVEDVNKFYEILKTL